MERVLPHFTDEGPEAQLAKAPQMANSRDRFPASASPTPEPVPSHVGYYAPVEGGLAERWGGNKLHQQPGVGHEVQGLAFLPGHTCCVTSGKSHTLSELHCLNAERRGSCLPCDNSSVVRPWGTLALSPGSSQDRSGLTPPASPRATATEAAARSQSQPHVLCHQWACPPPPECPCSPIDIQRSLGAQHTHGIDGLPRGHMDHCALGHSPASPSLQVQEAPWLVPLYGPAEP